MNSAKIDHCNRPGLMPVEQAINTMLDSLSAVNEQHTLDVVSAQGLVLAQPVYSDINVPPAANSAMDGYAFAMAGLPASGELTLIGSSFAGAPYQGKLGAGQCVRIMTGGVIPVGADTVVMQENTEPTADNIRILHTPKKGDNIRRCGEDIKAGQLLLDAGRKISAVDIGLLCSIGVSKIQVFRRLKVALFSTDRKSVV